MQIFSHDFSYIMKNFSILMISIIVIAIVNIIIWRILHHLHIRLKEKYKEWNGAITKSIEKYIAVFSLLLITWLIVYELEIRHIDVKAQSKILQIISIVFVILVTLIIERVLGQLKKFLAIRIDNDTEDKIKYSKSDIHALFYFIGFLIWIVALIVILSILRISISTLVGFGGAGTLVATFIFKNSLENLAGGAFLNFDRPFMVGDWIYTTDEKIEGTVEKIGWRLTKIRQFDKRPVYVPNATFVTSAVVNASRMSNRRIKQYIGIRYCDMPVVAKILTDIKKFLGNHPEIDQKMITLVNLVDGSENGGAYGAYAINVVIYTFTKTTNWVEYKDIQDEILLSVGNIIKSYGGDIAFPSQSIYMENAVKILQRESHS